MSETAASRASTGTGLERFGVSALYVIVMLSGTAGLGYQMAWTRMLSTSLGHEFAAVLAVVAAFFVGLALGGLLLNRAIRNAARPARWYVVLELIIGLWALLLILILPYFNQWTALWIGTEPGPVWHWCAAFSAALLALLPATIAMGATLPAIERVVRSRHGGETKVAGLYAANTAGALLGTLIATYVFLPALGLNATLLLFAMINLGIAAMMWVAASKQYVTVPTVQSLALPGRRLLSVLFLTGLLGLGYEVLVVRVLSQALEGTVYTFAAVLAVYLLGTACGAAWYQSSVSGSADRWAQVSNRLLIATGVSCLLGSAALFSAEVVYATVLASLGPGSLSGMLAELSVAGLVFLIPTLCMGALFSHLAQHAIGQTGLGAAMGINTLGAALAPVIFGVLLLPAIGARSALVLITVAYLLLPLATNTQATSRRSNLLLAGAASTLLFLPLPLRFISVPADSEVMVFEEGVVAAVAVVQEPDGSRHLKVNNRFTMGGTASRFSDHRQTHLPLLWHGGAAGSALYLGLGTGITFQAAQYYPGLKATGVELIPEAPGLMPLFGVDVEGPHWRHAPRVLHADARRFVLADEQRYDVVIAEVFHPSRDGAGNLYTVEHFAAVNQRLAPGGLFCQWLPLFQLDLATLRLITRSFLEVFPNAQMHLAHFSLGQPLLCLLGGEGVQPFSAGWLQSRVHDRKLQQQLVDLRLNSDFALFGGYLGGTDALRAFSGAGPLNTDDHPRVTFAAPAFVYGAPESPAQRLLTLTQQLAPQRGTLMSESERHSVFGRRLEDYWRARDLFLQAGVGIRPSNDVRAMLAQTQEKLLAAVRQSADFLPAYEPLLSMARALYAQDPRAAYELLLRLETANPELGDARRLRLQLFGQQ